MRPTLLQNIKATNDFKLYLKYINGETVVVDMNEFKENFQGIVKNLSSLEFFKKVKVEDGMAAWPMGIDLDPEELYELGSVISQQEFAAA